MSARVTRAMLDEPLIVGESRPIITFGRRCLNCAGASAEASYYADRADTPGSVARQLAARRALADRFPKGVLAAGREPNATVHVSTARPSEGARCG